MWCRAGSGSQVGRRQLSGYSLDGLDALDGLMMLRSARSTDLAAISKLLFDSALPTMGVAEQLDAFVVLESGASIVGVGGLELHGAVALIRSLAVAANHQGSGGATAICDHLEAEGASRGVEEIYLLTETAASFFKKRGYSEVSRGSAPREIAASEEFSEICPQSAVFMRRSIEKAPPPPI